MEALAYLYLADTRYDDDATCSESQNQNQLTASQTPNSLESAKPVLDSPQPVKPAKQIKFYDDVQYPLTGMMP